MFGKQRFGGNYAYFGSFLARGEHPGSVAVAVGLGTRNFAKPGWRTRLPIDAGTRWFTLIMHFMVLKVGEEGAAGSRITLNARIL